MGKLDDAQADGKLLLLAGDLLTMLLLTTGCALAFLSGYGIDLDLGAVIVFCSAASVASVVLHRMSHPWGTLLALAGLIGIYWYNWEEISPVLVWIGQKMNLLPVLTGLPLAVQTPKDDVLMPVILLLCASLAWEMGWTVVRARRWYLAALVHIVLVLPAIQMGVLPAWGGMMMAFVGWGAMLLTALFGRRDAGSLGRAQLLSLVGMCALALLLVMALPMQGYVRPQWATNARNDLIRGVNRQLEKFFDLDELNDTIFADLGIDLSIPDENGQVSSSVYAGNGTSIADSAFALREDLTAAGPRRYSNRRILTVNTTQLGGDRVYLRGGSLGKYTGDAWEWDESGGEPFFGEPTAFPSLYPAATARDAPVYTMTIRDIVYRGSNFYPYRLTDGSGTTDEAGRLTLPWEAVEDYDPLLNGEEEYRIDYCPGGPEDGFVLLTGALAEEERRYRNEVIPRYLEVPDELRNGVAALLSDEPWEIILQSLEQELENAEEDEREALEQQIQNITAAMGESLTLDSFGEAAALTDDMSMQERYDAVIAAASRTAALLSAMAVYDPNVLAMEQGEDFVLHFLREGRGYCVHFATAGALLLRMQGFPTRYVTGYVVDLSSQGQGRALDSDAHAWVEIYLNGYGWFPVEMTPGYAGGDSGVELFGAASPQPSEDEEITPDETPEEETAPDAEEDTQEEELPEETLPEEEEAEEADTFVWKLLGGIVLAAAALGGVYALSFLPGKYARKNLDTNRSVISAYQRYSRLLRWGGVEDETLEELGRKAKFSQHTLSEEERQTAWDCLERSVEQARRRQIGWRKLVFPLLKPLW